MDLKHLQAALGPDWLLSSCARQEKGLYRCTGVYQGQARVFSLLSLKTGRWRYQERGHTFIFDLPGQSSKSEASAEASVAYAPMDGLLRKIEVIKGSAVAKGQALYTLESMKMQVQICAPSAGVVLAICVTPGSQICKGQEILEWQGTQHA